MSKQLDMAVMVYGDNAENINRAIIELADNCLSGKCPPHEYLEDGLWEPFLDYTGVDGDTYARLLDDYGTEDDEINFLIGVWMTTLINDDYKRYQTIIDQFKFFLSEGV